jgi:phosphate transport system substrate-binding protein
MDREVTSRAAATLLLGLLFAGLGSLAVEAADISGAGSTFVYPVLAKWAEAYHAGQGVAVDYQSVGSGAGIVRIKSKSVDFGTSDAPLPPADLEASGLVQFPLVVGGDVPVVNLSGLEAAKLRMTGQILTDIYLGKITKWNDEAITQLNPDLALPDQNITVVHRADGSGTTYIWADYLAKMSLEWKEKIGVGTLVNWPVGLAGSGNDGVANLVVKTAGAIGYVEYAYAKERR